MFAGRTVILNSRLPVDAAIAALAAVTEPWERDPITDRDAEVLSHIRFIGDITGDRFQVMTKEEPYRQPDLSFARERNMARPTCKGNITARADGSLIEIELHARPLSIFALGSLLVFMATFAAVLVYQSMLGPLAVLVLVFGSLLALHIMTLLKMRRRAVEELSAIFQSR